MMSRGVVRDRAVHAREGMHGIGDERRDLDDVPDPAPPPLAHGGVAAASGALRSPAAAERAGEQAHPAFTLTDTNGKTHSLVRLPGQSRRPRVVQPRLPLRQEALRQRATCRSSRRATPGREWSGCRSSSSAPGKQGNYSPATLERADHGEGRVGRPPCCSIPTAAVGREYGAKTTPHMYVIDGQGVLLYAGAIDSIASADQEDIPRATNYVAGAIDAVLAGKSVEPATTQSYGCSVKY